MHAVFADGLANDLAFMAARIVAHDDIAWCTPNSSAAVRHAESNATYKQTLAKDL